MHVPLPPPRALALLLALLAPVVHAQSSLPPQPVRLESLAEFRPASPNWNLAGGLAGDPRRDKHLATTEGTGLLVCTPGTTKETRGHLFTAWEHGDLELSLEFLLPPGSNSGVYLQGRYEVQLFDSWAKRTVTAGDCGGIYDRWDAARGKGNESYGGHAPRANASRAPGLWQTLQIAFEAPRFDADGRKTRNARFTRVALNGFVIHENVEIGGPTRSAAFEDERPLGPLMIQGDHGSVALRNVAVKRFGPETIAVRELRYQLHAGSFSRIGAYDTQKPASEGVPARFAHGAVEKPGKFALVFTGTMTVPRDGDYRFAAESPGLARLLIDGRPVITPLDRGSQPGVVRLTAGAHPFRLDFVHNANNRPAFELLAEGPGIAPQTLTVREREPRGAAVRPKQLRVDVQDRIVLQRAFVPFEPRKRLYAAAVGTPAGVHYAYDFETGALLRAWRGPFIDTAEMWEGRGNDQTARPEGPELTFNGKPTVALIEYAQRGDWPDQPDPLWQSQGYTLEANGQPVFNAMLAELGVRDRIAPGADGRSLERTLTFFGKVPSWSTWVMIAEAASITAQPDGRGWIVGDRAWYVDWPASAGHTPLVRTVNGRQQLAVPLTNASLAKPVNYSIVW